MIYLDNAATSGTKPREVKNAVNYALNYLSANPGRSGHKASFDAANAVFSVRSKVHKFFNSESENSVCFVGNCTTAINYVLQGNLGQGDHILISSLEHNAVYRPLFSMAQDGKITFDVVNIDVNSPDSCVLEFQRKIKSNTKMIFVTAASNVTGTTLPLKKLGLLCKENNILFGVDAAQAAGHIEINMKELGIDFLCVAAHKGLFAPMGAGILITDKPIKNVIIKGGTGVDSLNPRQPEMLPEGVESGTLNVPGICGIGGGIDFLKRIEKVKPLKQEKQLLSNLYYGLRRIGAELYTEDPVKEVYLPVLSFNINGKSGEETALYLASKNIAVRGGFHCAPLAHKTIGTADRGTVRVSPSFLNNSEEIEKLLFYVKKYNF